jgi:hypothetical protein
MEALSLWHSKDLSNPGSREWKKRFALWVQDNYPDLGVYAVVGRQPRPMCFVYRRNFAELVEGWRNDRDEKSRGERWALCCSKAKFAVFVGSDRPELTWGVVSRQAEQGEIAFGLYIENGYEKLPPDKVVNPFRDEGIDHRFFVRTGEWDWNRFKKSILDAPTGRRLVTDLMRNWDRPLFLRLDPVDPDGVSLARRYWFDGNQLWHSDESSPEGTVRTSEIKMWDWICHRADHKTAWFNVMLLEFVRHTRGCVDPGSAERVRMLLDAVRPLLRLCW